jgi:hypothetical protein
MPRKQVVKKRPARKKPVKATPKKPVKATPRKKPPVKRRRKQTGDGRLSDAYEFVKNNKKKIMAGLALGAAAAGVGMINNRRNTAYQRQLSGVANAYTPFVDQRTAMQGHVMNELYRDSVNTYGDPTYLDGDVYY